MVRIIDVSEEFAAPLFRVEVGSKSLQNVITCSSHHHLCPHTLVMKVATYQA
jgi:hypothetical protein